MPVRCAVWLGCVPRRPGVTWWPAPPPRVLASPAHFPIQKLEKRWASRSSVAKRSGELAERALRFAKLLGDERAGTIHRQTTPRPIESGQRTFERVQVAPACHERVFAFRLAAHHAFDDRLFELGESRSLQSRHARRRHQLPIDRDTRFDAAQVDLVPHQDPRRRSAGALHERRRFHGARAGSVVDDHKHQIRAVDRVSRPFDADPFHRVRRLPKPCGIVHVKRNARNDDPLSYHVPGHARNVGDDGGVGAGQMVEQARLSDVRCARTSLTPLRSTAPRRESASVPATALRNAPSRADVSVVARRSISSSGKSRDASMNARSSMSASRWLSTVLENSPESDRRAHRTADADPPSTRFTIASAFARSMRSLRNARNVNSPASAGRAPSSQTRSSTMRATTAPPWPWSSRTSSPRERARGLESQSEPVVDLGPRAVLELGAHRHPRSRFAVKIPVRDFARERPRNAHHGDAAASRAGWQLPRWCRRCGAGSPAGTGRRTRSIRHLSPTIFFVITHC